MTLKYRAAVLHQAGKPLAIEQVSSGDPAPTDVVVRVRADGLCHTDLEVIDGSLRYPLPMILGHEAAGVVEQIGPEVDTVKVGDHVILSWNPHCGHCFQCDRGQPILCDTYLGEGPKGLHFDGRSKPSYGGARPLRDFPLLARAYLEGRLKLDELITARARLDDINRGFADLREGRSIRTVIEF